MATSPTPPCILPQQVEEIIDWLDRRKFAAIGDQKYDLARQYRDAVHALRAGIVTPDAEILLRKFKPLQPWPFAHAA